MKLNGVVDNRTAKAVKSLQERFDQTSQALREARKEIEALKARAVPRAEYDRVVEHLRVTSERLISTTAVVDDLLEIGMERDRQIETLRLDKGQLLKQVALDGEELRHLRGLKLDTRTLRERLRKKSEELEIAERRARDAEQKAGLRKAI